MNEGTICYRAFGLNLFAVHTYDQSELMALQNVPLLYLVQSLLRPSNTTVMVDTNAIGNWVHDQWARFRRKTAILDLIGRDTPFSEVPIGIYGGRFSRIQGDECSIACHYTESMLPGLINAFVAWDALLFLAFGIRQDGLSLVPDALWQFSADQEIIVRLLRDARFLLRTQDDAQFVEVITQDTTVEGDLRAASAQASEYICGTKWYKDNARELVWDDLEKCLVKRSV